MSEQALVSDSTSAAPKPRRRGLRMFLGLIYKLIRPFRKKRMARFQNNFELHDDTTILDVGGTPFNWSLIGYPGTVKIINVVATESDPNAPARYTTAIADGTNLEEPDRTYDIVFSNSVIEHVGDFAAQKRFADEVRRVGNGLWVQTPARCFFLEPHYLTPFIHWLPVEWQRKLLRNFTVWGLMSRPNKQTVDECVDMTRLLNFKQMQELFPDCEIRKERFLFLTKAYVAVRKPTAG